MTAPPASSLRIAGYDGFERIGSGGFSAVYRARQASLGRHVAIKVLNGDFASESDRQTFERECHAMGLLSRHPNIVTVHSETFTDDGRPCIVMELYRGNYRERLDERGPLGVAELLTLGVKIAGALQSVHDAGILHRDIKPHNIFVSDYGEPALGDFGISTIEGERSITGTGGLSVAYAAPEVLEDSATGVASDLYSLAASLFHLLDGAAPFSSGDIRTTVRRILTEPVRRPTANGVPARLFDALEAALAKHPSDRPVSALAFAQSLRAVQASIGLDRTTTPLADDRLIDTVSDEIDSLDRSRNTPGAGPSARLDDTEDRSAFETPPILTNRTAGDRNENGGSARPTEPVRGRRPNPAPRGLRAPDPVAPPAPPRRVVSTDADDGAAIHQIGQSDQTDLDALEHRDALENTVSRAGLDDRIGRAPPDVDRTGRRQQGGSGAQDRSEASPVRRRVAVGLGAVSVVAVLGVVALFAMVDDDGSVTTPTTVARPIEPDDDFLAILQPPARLGVTGSDSGTAVIRFEAVDGAVAYEAISVAPSKRTGIVIRSDAPPIDTDIAVDDAICWEVVALGEGGRASRPADAACTDE